MHAITLDPNLGPVVIGFMLEERPRPVNAPNAAEDLLKRMVNSLRYLKGLRLVCKLFCDRVDSNAQWYGPLITPLVHSPRGYLSAKNENWAHDLLAPKYYSDEIYRIVTNDFSLCCDVCGKLVDLCEKEHYNELQREIMFVTFPRSFREGRKYAAVVYWLTQINDIHCITHLQMIWEATGHLPQDTRIAFFSQVNGPVDDLWTAVKEFAEKL